MLDLFRGPFVVELDAARAWLCGRRGCRAERHTRAHERRLLLLHKLWLELDKIVALHLPEVHLALVDDERQQALVVIPGHARAAARLGQGGRLHLLGSSKLLLGAIHTLRLLSDVKDSHAARVLEGEQEVGLVALEPTELRAGKVSHGQRHFAQELWGRQSFVCVCMCVCCVWGLKFEILLTFIVMAPGRKSIEIPRSADWIGDYYATGNWSAAQCRPRAVGVVAMATARARAR